MFGDGLPLPQVGFHQPVDHLGYFTLDALWCIGHYLLLEFALDALLLDQVHDASQADRFVEVFLSTCLHLIQDIFHVGDAELEIAPHILFVDR